MATAETRGLRGREAEVDPVRIDAARVKSSTRASKPRSSVKIAANGGWIDSRS
jgi:hypothetical protein